MNEKQKTFIEDSLIASEFTTAVSAHDVEVAGPLVGEEDLARLSDAVITQTVEHGNGARIEAARARRADELRRHLTHPELRAIDLDALTGRFQVGQWLVEVAAMPGWHESGRAEGYTWSGQAFWRGRGEAVGAEGYGALGALLAHYEHMSRGE